MSPSQIPGCWRWLTGLASLLAAIPACGSTSADRRAEAPATAAVTASAAAPEVLPTPLPGDRFAVTIHRLDNGLTVYISPDPTQTRVSAWIAVRAGSRHDPPDSTGLAHYLEHMLFKGTDRLGTLDGEAERPVLEKISGLYRRLRTERDPAQRQSLLTEIDRQTAHSGRWAIPGEIAQLYAGLGAKALQAFTSQDFTGFRVDLPANRLAQWARIEAERLARPSFRFFLHELEAVYQERNDDLDSPDSRSMEALLARTFPGHPYGDQSTVGSAEHLHNPAFDEMVAYFQRWYVPNNMAIVLAGKVDAATALPLLKAHFGLWQPRPLPAPPAAPLAPLRGRQHAQVQAPAVERVDLAWRTVPHGHPDEIPLTVANVLLSFGSSSLLKGDLVNRHLVQDASARHLVGNQAGALLLWASAQSGQSLEDVERLLLGAVDKLRRADFADADLAATVRNYQIAEARALESPEARAALMALAFTSGQPWRNLAGRSDRWRSVTRADVARVARQYLGPDFAVTYRRHGEIRAPKLAKPAITAIPLHSGRQSAFARELMALPMAAAPSGFVEIGRDFQRGRLPAGKLIVVPNARNDLYQIEYRFDLGSRRQPLLCLALRAQQAAGAGNLGAEALQKRLFALAATVKTDCGPDETTITISGSDAQMNETLDLVRSWFRAPVFDQTTVPGALLTVLSERKVSLADHKEAAGALAFLVAQGQHAGGRHGPLNAHLMRARAEELARLLRSLPDHQHKTLYFGPRAQIASDSALVLGPGQRRVPRRSPTRFHRGSTPSIRFLDVATAQGRLDVVLRIGQIAPRERAAALVLQSYMSGMDGAVFRTIRESRGLAYDAEGSVVLGLRADDEAILACRVHTAPEKAVETLELLLALLRGGQVDERQFAAARQVVIERLTNRPATRRLPVLVDTWDEHGERGDPRPALLQRVLAMRAAEVSALWKRATRSPAMIAVAGDSRRIDRKALAKVARVQPVTAEQIFGYGAFPAGMPPIRVVPAPKPDSPLSLAR